MPKGLDHGLDGLGAREQEMAFQDEGGHAVEVGPAGCGLFGQDGVVGGRVGQGRGRDPGHGADGSEDGGVADVRTLVEVGGEQGVRELVLTGRASLLEGEAQQVARAGASAGLRSHEPNLAVR